MKTVEVKDEQTLLDIALQHYGTAEAVGKILSDNPGLANEPSAPGKITTSNARGFTVISESGSDCIGTMPPALANRAISSAS